MSYVNTLIDRTKDFLPKKTDYAFCKAVGVTWSHLKMIKTGKGFFGAKQRMRIHEITSIPHEELTSMLELERSKSDDDKAFWSKRLPRLSAASFIALSLIAAFHGHHGAIATAFFMPTGFTDLYIMRSLFIVGMIFALLNVTRFAHCAATRSDC